MSPIRKEDIHIIHPSDLPGHSPHASPSEEDLSNLIDSKISHKVDLIAGNMDRALAGRIAQEGETQRRVEGLEGRMGGLMIVNGVMAVVGAVLGGIWVGGWIRRRNGMGEERGGRRDWDERDFRDEED
jgi:hypothetical protein